MRWNPNQSHSSPIFCHKTSPCIYLLCKNASKFSYLAAFTLLRLLVQRRPSRSFRPLPHCKSTKIPVLLMKLEDIYSPIYALKLPLHTYALMLLHYPRSSNSLRSTTSTANVQRVWWFVFITLDTTTIRRLQNFATSNYVDTFHRPVDAYKFTLYTLACSAV